MGCLRYLLLLSLMAAAWTLLGAGTAGAAVLCTTNANCATSHHAGGQMYDKGDTITANAAKVQYTTSAGTMTCNKSWMQLELTGTGGLGLVVPIDFSWGFQECTLLTPGGMNVKCADVEGFGFTGSISLAGAPNGTLTLPERFVPFSCGESLDCWLGSKDLKFPIGGGNPASLAVTKLGLETKAGLPVCPETVTLDATYITETPVYVFSG